MMAIDVYNSALGPNGSAFYATGSIPILHGDGVEVTGLTVGNIYSVEAVNGPWYYKNDLGWWVYRFWIIHDGSAKNSCGGNAFDGYVEATVGDIIIDAENYIGDGDNYNRVFFQATVTSVFVAILDTLYSDNIGSIDYIVRDAMLPGILTNDVKLGSEAMANGIFVSGVRLD